MPSIVRLTLFKIPDAHVVRQLQAKYASLTRSATKDGSTYIQSSAGHVTHEDPRSNGYNFVARTEFLSKDDMDYYDTQCPAHSDIKALLKGNLKDGPPLVVYMDV